MNILAATLLESWVNNHDDGTPQPRAKVKAKDGAWVVEITSTVVHPDKTTSQETDIAHSHTEARAILGY